MSTKSSNDHSLWTPGNAEHEQDARDLLKTWPLDDYNAVTLNEVHPRNYQTPSAAEHDEEYDLIAIGAGAGGLVSSRQSARRGAKSAMISEHLAGGDCLNVGCVPSKALIAAAKTIRTVKRSAEFGVVLPEGHVKVDFGKIMKRLREKRADIAKVDGHTTSEQAGTHVYQGRGRFTSPNTIQVGDKTLKFKKAVIATGGRPRIPNIPGLKEAPYFTNEILFNLQVLPPRMVILGDGVVGLEMAQCFATFGSSVTVLGQSSRLFESRHGDAEAADLIKQELEKSGVQFLAGTTKSVETITGFSDDPSKLPLVKLVVEVGGKEVVLECECLLVATGRAPNVENVGLEAGNVTFEKGKGITVNDLAQSISNPNVYAVGDCVADVPRLTHMSGEMAKLVVQNALFDDSWKLSSFVVPATMYTEPELATVGISSEGLAQEKEVAVDVYRTGLEHNDRAILEGSNIGFCKIFCKAGTDEILGATIVAERAGEMINEVTLAMKNGIGLYQVGRNIHCYPTTGEAVGFCGVQFINSRWKRLDDKNK
jgi:pyruvate/2-oxoglutarate dehydrogenase complex dihydrolipoamide dehydrogenase (E3) component